MRRSLLFFVVAITILIGNLIDLFFNNLHDPVGNIVAASVAIIVAAWLLEHMWRTPDRNFVPLSKVKKYLPEELIKDFKKKGPFQ